MTTETNTGDDLPASPDSATSPNRSQAANTLPDGSYPAISTPALLGTASASASCVSAPGHDANGTIVAYEPEKAIDNISDTAWRCDGDGVGEWLEISFENVVTLTSIGIVPGYAKTDPGDRTDRYAQNRRISAVSYRFDDGSTVTQSLNTGASDRAVQTMSLSNLSTRRVTVTILSSVRGDVAGVQQPLNKVAISEFTASVR